MGKYTVKIITQGLVKIYGVITMMCSSLVYGYDHHQEEDILRVLRTRGVYYQTGFNTQRVSTAALFSYRTKIIRHGIWQLKFKNNKHIARTFGMVVCDYLLEELSSQYYVEHFTQPILVTVPVSNKTKRIRGYNQNHLILTHALTYGLADWVDYRPQLITKPTHTKPQSHSHSKHVRMKNTRGVFQLAQTKQVSGRNVIVFDDVYTTGSTLDEVTRILKRAGARKIMRVTVAH